MNTQSVQSIDQTAAVVATAQVVEKDGRFSGRVDLSPMPANLRQLFDEFEEIVNDQVFSLLDEVEEKIAAHALKVVLADGQPAPCDDLQVYPSTGRISFRLVCSGRPGAVPASR